MCKVVVLRRARRLARSAHRILASRGITRRKNVLALTRVLHPLRLYHLLRIVGHIVPHHFFHGLAPRAVAAHRIRHVGARRHLVRPGVFKGLAFCAGHAHGIGKRRARALLPVAGRALGSAWAAHLIDGHTRRIGRGTRRHIDKVPSLLGAPGNGAAELALRHVGPFGWIVALARTVEKHARRWACCTAGRALGVAVQCAWGRNVVVLAASDAARRACREPVGGTVVDGKAGAQHTVGAARFAHHCVLCRGAVAWSTRCQLLGRAILLRRAPRAPFVVGKAQSIAHGILERAVLPALASCACICGFRALCAGAPKVDELIKRGRRAQAPSAYAVGGRRVCRDGAARAWRALSPEIHRRVGDEHEPRVGPYHNFPNGSTYRVSIGKDARRSPYKVGAIE